MRSNKAIAVSGCLLHQSLMAVGCEAAPAVIRPVIEWALENDIGLVPWTCPETVFAGLPRKPRGIERYRADGLGSVAKQIAEAFAYYLRIQTDGGVHILAAVGVSFSPACSVRRQSRHKHERGLFIQALDRALSSRGLSIPIIDIDRTKPAAILEALDGLLQPKLV